jgi:hypothetical protein
MAEPDARFERLRAAAAASNIRSPLARYLSAHHDQFAALLSDYRPRWDALVEQWAADGLLTLPQDWHSDDEHVRSITRQKVIRASRRTWERVKAKKVTTKPAPQPAATKPVTQTQQTHPVEPAKLPTSNSMLDDIRSKLSTGLKMPDPINPKRT